VPERAPRGIVGEDDAFVFNDADYQRLRPEIEEEMQQAGTTLAGLIQREIERRFEVSPHDASS
jgi:hypothetical protein